jgi:DNA-binding NtrC family response regulator
MAGRRILIVDDYPTLVEFLTDQLTREGYEIVTATTGARAIEILDEGFSGVILLDVQLPDVMGLDLFHKIQAARPLLPVIFITAHATLNLAVEATRVGAFDFIAKSSDLMKRLSVSVKNAFNHLSMTEELSHLKGERANGNPFPEFRTVTPRMQQILETLQSVVNSQVTVLIEGESGTGKEVVARGIHAAGSRRAGPFVAVNCAGIPETLLESEMFGYEKGAFTGATARRAGKFEAAHGGTLFLDEVGELPKALQAKLLRVLQDHSFERVGGTETIQVDTRIVSATNRDLMQEVRKGNFREDLFYRLSVFPVRLLPLRDRPDDIPVLAQHFLRRFAREENRDIRQFEPAALQLLKAQPFPGNVRELENLIRHVVIVARGTEITAAELVATLGSHRVQAGQEAAAVRAGSLGQRLAQAFPTLDSLAPMKDLQAAYAQRALEVSDRNISRTARALGLGRATLYRWLRGEESFE